MRIAVVLVEPIYEENIGYVARVMKNFGVKELVLVNPKCNLGLEAIKRSMHARDVLENASLVDSLEKVISRYDIVFGTTGKHGKRFSQVRRFITPEVLAERIKRFEGSIALVFGREDKGLTNKELAMCDGVVTIPANPEYPILNLSHAIAVILYEVYKALGTPHVEVKLSLPSRAEVDVLLRYIRNLSMFLWNSERRAERTVLTIKRMLSSCLVRREDVRVLLGLIRESYERLEKCHPEGKRG